jgi:hypothetical protein
MLLKNANGHQVNLITSDNYDKYCNIPDYIMKKVNNKTVTLTHLSDILRVFLLEAHGGLWVDSTVLVTTTLPDHFPPLFSLKCKKDPFKNVAENRWAGSFIYMNKGNILADFLKNIFSEYWRHHNKMIDYFLIDYFIAIAYDTIPSITQMIDAIPETDNLIHGLQDRLNSAYKQTVFDEIDETTKFHKLTYKMELQEYTGDGELTFYGYIINKYK